MRKIFFDTETTGLSANFGDRVIELAFVEMIDHKINEKKRYYLNPEGRKSSRMAFEVHGIKDNFLLAKPYFYQVIDEWIDWIKGAELFAHNAKFDIDMINNELRLAARAERIDQICTIFDTMDIARQKLPAGSRLKLEIIAKYLNIEIEENSQYHSALTDSTVLAQVYVRLHKTKENLFGEIQNQTNSLEAGLSAITQDLLTKFNQSKKIKVKLAQISKTEQKLHNDFFNSEK